MKIVTLNRYQLPGVTFGRLQVDAFEAVTLEREWLDNAVNVSCILIGDFICEWRESPKFGWCYHVLDVPGRSHILFHAGNLVKHTLGCICPGARVGRIGGEPAVLDSRNTLHMFTNYMNEEPFLLKIRGPINVV